MNAPQIPSLQFHTPSKDEYQNSSSQQQQKHHSQQHHQYSQHKQQLHQNTPIQNYILGQTIGQGTFNKVKIARHLLTNEKVAIKIIDKSSIQTQADKKRLDLQLKILRKVRHPNIAQLYEIFENRSNLFLVTEYCSRGELFEHILTNEKLTQFEACKFLQQLLDAIQYIHQLGVTHRDLKPQNILLDHKYNIKLIDFGLSNIYSRDQKLHTACGSPCYAPPQMLCGRPYDGLKADIWSAGVILYAMCCGYLPFDSPDTVELYKAIKEGRYDLPEGVSEELRDLLGVVLEVDPDRRANIDQIRRHAFCKFSPLRLTPGIIVGLSDIPYQEYIQHQIIQEIYLHKNLNHQQKQQLKQKLKHSIKFNKHNELSATYYLILQRNLKFQNETLVNYYIRKNNLVNRYSIAQKVKLIYDRKLQQKALNHSQLHNVKKDKAQSKNKNKTKFSQTHKKQTLNIVELYDKSKQKEHLNQERRLNTTNTKRKQDQNQADKVFKKTRLNFNQIQLEQKRNQKATPTKPNDNRSFSKTNNNQRIRNKSVAVINKQSKPVEKSPSKTNQKLTHKTYENTPGKHLKRSPEKTKQLKLRESSQKKKRTQSQNAFYNKTSHFNVENSIKRLQRKDNIKNDDRIKQKSRQKSSHKKLKVKINTHFNL